MQEYMKNQFEALKRTKRPWIRRTAGVSLIMGGLVGFLPVLGYWMLPLGLALLAVDSPRARRLYRQLAVWWGRRYQSLRRCGRSGRRTINAEPVQTHVDNLGKRNGSC